MAASYLFGARERSCFWGGGRCYARRHLRQGDGAAVTGAAAWRRRLAAHLHWCVIARVMCPPPLRLFTHASITRLGAYCFSSSSCGAELTAPALLSGATLDLAVSSTCLAYELQVTMKSTSTNYMRDRCTPRQRTRQCTAPPKHTRRASACIVNDAQRCGQSQRKARLCSALSPAN